MNRIVKLTERDLNNLVKKVLKEEQESENYMFFSNLKLSSFNFSLLGAL